MLKRNLIFLNISQSMSLTGLMICAFRLSVWKLFVLILRRYCKLLFENSLTKNAEHFVFLSFKPQPFLSFHASWYLHVLLVKAGVSDAVLISLSSDDCFPPKKEYSGPCTGFRFNILWLMF